MHFVIDSVRAEKLREKWTRADRGVALDFIDCPDRRLTKAATDLVEREIEDPGTHVTVILPRRSYSPLLGRLLHDRTADKIAAAVSRIPRSAATIVPYDVPEPGRGAAGQAGGRQGGARPGAGRRGTVDRARRAEQRRRTQRPLTWRRPREELARESDVVTAHSVPTAVGQRQPRRASPRSAPSPAGKVTVEGKVRVVEIRPVERNSVLAVEINDSTGNLTAMFYGRSHIPGLICGARVRFTGSARIRGGQPVMINPAYELVSPARRLRLSPLLTPWQQLVRRVDHGGAAFAHGHLPGEPDARARLEAGDAGPAVELGGERSRSRPRPWRRTRSCSRPGGSPPTGPCPRRSPSARRSAR